MRCPAADCTAAIAWLKVPGGQARWLHGRAGHLDVDLRQPVEAVADGVEEWLDALHAHLAGCPDCAWLNRPHALVVD